MAGLCCAFYICHILTDRAQFILLYRSLCYSSFRSTGHSVTVHFALPVTLLQFISIYRSLYYSLYLSTGHSITVQFALLVTITVHFALPVTLLQFISLYRSLYAGFYILATFLQVRIFLNLRLFDKLSDYTPVCLGFLQLFPRFFFF